MNIAIITVIAVKNELFMKAEAFNDQLADMVRQHRKKSQLSQIELAQLAGVGKSVIYELEHGKATVRLDSVLKVLNALNISVHLSSPMVGEQV